MQRQLATVNATYHELSELEILLDQLGSKEVVISEDGYYQLTGDNDFQTTQALPVRAWAKPGRALQDRLDNVHASEPHNPSLKRDTRRVLNDAKTMIATNPSKSKLEEYHVGKHIRLGTVHQNGTGFIGGYETDSI